MRDDLEIHYGDNREILPELPENSVDCVFTSPPYWKLRDYGTGPDQLGREPTWQLYIDHMVEVGRHIRRVLKPGGSYYTVLGDTYLDKSLLLLPSRQAIALGESGWTLRNKIVWYKPNHNPSPFKDRLTNSYEEIFHFVQNQKYYYDLDSIREPHKVETIDRWASEVRSGRLEHPSLNLETKSSLGIGTVSKLGHSNLAVKPDPKGRNPADTITKHDLAVDRGGQRAYSDPLHTKGYHPLGRNPADFSKVTTKPYPKAHFAVFPEDICIPRIKSSCPPGGTVLDPFAGSGTALKVALDLGRRAVGIEVNKEYQELIERRLSVHVPEWGEKYAMEDAKRDGIAPLTEWDDV